MTTYKTIWITGASSGIGLELAKLYAAAGSKVAISARSGEKLAELEREHTGLHAFPCDVTDAEAMSATFTKITERLGPVDLAVLNAGTWTPTTVKNFSTDKMRKTIDVNYMGVVHALDSLIPEMMKRGDGHISIVASVAGYRGLPKSMSYGPTKAALINLAETLRIDLRKYGVRVSVINPGFVDTPMTAKNDFPMPFIMPPEKAARRMKAGLDGSGFEIAFPKRFVAVLKTARVMPYRMYFWFVRTFVDQKR